MSIRSKALASLKTKFEGVDEKVLSRIVAKVAKTAKSEDDVDDIVSEMTIQSVIDSYTDSRVTEGSASAIESYEKKHGIKDGKPAKKTEKDTDDVDDGDGEDGEGKNEKVPSWATALFEEIKSLKAEKTQNTRQSRVEEMLKDADEATKKRTLREFGRCQFKDDADFDSWIDEVTEDIKTVVTKQTPPPATKPKGGAGAGTAEEVNPLVKARTEAYTKAAETQTSAIQGL